MGYSDSPLVTYRHITEKKSKRRYDKIDTIIIHCIVGQCTAKDGVEWFYETPTDCSVQYVVGRDGSVGQSVEEEYRAWTTGGVDHDGKPIRVNGFSGADMDHRAVTIEVASDTTPPYAITDEAYEALVKLCADICMRNGIGALKWCGDKSLVGVTDKQNMAVHRWFAYKDCPGDYIYERLGEIAGRVNKIIEEEIDDMTIKCPCCGADITVSLEVKARTTTTHPETTRKSDEELAREVMRGVWGNGRERKDRLTAAGYDYGAVQSIVNAMCK